MPAYGFICRICKERFELPNPALPVSCPACSSFNTRRSYQFNVGKPRQQGGTDAEAGREAEPAAPMPVPKFYDPSYTGRRFQDIAVANATEVGIKVEGVPFVGKDIRVRNSPVGLDAIDADVDVDNLDVE